MPAHLRSLPGCSMRCGSPAVVELLDTHNARHGVFCRRCGAAAQTDRCWALAAESNAALRELQRVRGD